MCQIIHVKQFNKYENNELIKTLIIQLDIDHSSDLRQLFSIARRKIIENISQQIKNTGPDQKASSDPKEFKN